LGQKVFILRTPNTKTTQQLQVGTAGQWSSKKKRESRQSTTEELSYPHTLRKYFGKFSANQALIASPG